MPSPYLFDPIAYGIQHSDAGMAGWEWGLVVVLAILVGAIWSVGFGRVRTGRGQ